LLPSGTPPSLTNWVKQTHLVLKRRRPGFHNMLENSQKSSAIQ